MSAVDRLERAVLDNVLAGYSAQGYEVFRSPTPPLVPDFIAPLRPDAVAFGRGKNVAIEIVSSGATTTDRVRRLREATAGRPDWELRVVYIPRDEGARSVPVASGEAIARTLAEIDRLLHVDEARAALLLIWAALEAIGRRLVPDELAAAQTPGRLVEVLATLGHLTPSEAAAFRAAITPRNALVHGNVETTVDPRQIADLLNILRDLTTALGPLAA